MSRSDPYGSNSNSSGIEINLRSVLYDLLYCTSKEIPKGREGLLRKMRRDTNNELIRCACRDKITDEPDQDYYCRYCLGMGFYWDEVKIVYYRNDDSFSKRETKNEEFEGDDFFLEYDTAIATEDYIVTVDLDVNGSPSVPVTRGKMFKILSSDPFRSDNGRIEFVRVRAKEERKWSIWYGIKNRQHN